MTLDEVDQLRSSGRPGSMLAADRAREEILRENRETLSSLVSEGYCAVCYATGPIEADCLEVTTFYLLGFSANGATTVSLTTDIPLAAPVMDPISWLATLEAYRAAPANTVYAVESSQGKAPYQGQIIGYTYTRLQVADVYETTPV